LSNGTLRIYGFSMGLSSWEFQELSENLRVRKYCVSNYISLQFIVQ